MTQDPFPVLIPAAVGTGIAVNSEDRRRDFGAFLLHDETKGFLAFRARRLEGDFPGSGYRWSIYRGRGGILVTHCMEVVLEDITGPSQHTGTRELTVFQRRIDGGQ